jgi:hypothetical protein
MSRVIEIFGRWRNCGRFAPRLSSEISDKLARAGPYFGGNMPSGCTWQGRLSPDLLGPSFDWPQSYTTRPRRMTGRLGESPDSRSRRKAHLLQPQSATPAGRVASRSITERIINILASDGRHSSHASCFAARRKRRLLIRVNRSPGFPCSTLAAFGAAVRGNIDAYSIR